MRTPLVRLSLCLAVLLAVVTLASGARILPQEVTLHGLAPAEVKASVTAESATFSFDLPKDTVQESVQVLKDGLPVSVLLEPVFLPGTAAEPRQLANYRAQVTGAEAGSSLEVHFQAAGTRWKPTLDLRIQGTRGVVSALASITNDSLDMAGARVRLVSEERGEGGYTPYGSGSYLAYRMAAEELGSGALGGSAGTPVVVAEFDSLQVPVGSTRQVPLLKGEVTVTRTYQWVTYSSGEYEGDRGSTATTLYRFSNSTGKALPGGQITVRDGDLEAGDGYLVGTPAGESALVVLANTPGLRARREETVTPQPKTWENERTITLHLDNQRAEELPVRVVERAGYDGRGDSNDRVYVFSQEPSSTDRNRFVWEVKAPARQETTVRYSYREPMDLSTLRLVSFTADDSPKERTYLVEAPHTDIWRNSKGNSFRRLQPEGHALYRFPVPAGVKQAELEAWIGNSFRVSLAPEVGGKPGPFTVVADAIAISGAGIHDGESNFRGYIFDLSPCLSDQSRAVYFLLEDPSLTTTRGGAFIRTAQVYRIPAGATTRARPYPTGDTKGASATPVARATLFAFSPFTPEEKACIYEDVGTWLQDMLWPDRVRVADGNQRIVYVFTIPPEVPAASLTIKVGNQFALTVASDEGGKPGPFREQLNAIALMGHKPFLGENYAEYPLDLTPFLKDNPTRRIYVALSDADPTDGCGAAIAQLTVTPLDDAEKARVATRQHALDQFYAEQRHTLFYVLTDGGKEEMRYLYDQKNTRNVTISRLVEGEGYVIYHLPVRREDAGQQYYIAMRGDFLISLAPETAGKPGAFRTIAQAREIFGPEEVSRGLNRLVKQIDITEAMIADGGCFIKITDANPSELPGAWVTSIGMRRK